MYEELIKKLRNDAKVFTGFVNEDLLKAADAIELLVLQLVFRDETAKLIAQKLPKWIPVTERLPENRNMVLATVDGVVCVAFYGNYMWEEVETYSIFYPTHWMPLPEPPKDGE